MIRVMFVCHGNICRSPMAEFILKDMVEKEGEADNFFIASSATSYEEIGNPIHHGTAKILDRLGIDYSKKRAILLEKSDFEKYDYFIGMDSYNMSNMKRILKTDKKQYKLLEFAGLSRDVADPWYTGNFEQTFEDITLGCKCFIKKLQEK